MAMPSTGDYDIDGGHHLLDSRAPLERGEYEVVQGLELTDFSRAKIDATVGELRGGARRREGPDSRHLI